MFFMKFYYRCKFELYILAINLFTFKLRFQAAHLKLKLLYLRFRVRKSINCQRKTLANYVRYREGLERISGGVDEVHCSCPDILLAANDTAHLPGPLK